MCGRFTLAKTKAEINSYLSSLSIANLEDFTPHYNIAPTQNVIAIASINKQWQCQSWRWGLIPRWSSQPFKTNPLINARQETLAQKPSFKDAYVYRRCLILADGFYEWNRELYGKNPLYFHLNDHRIFAFAGLWETWTDSDGQNIHSVTIINTAAQGIMTEIHPRMPIVLNPSAYSQWLNPEITNPRDLDDLLQQNCRHDFYYYPVSDKVNFVKNNYPDLLTKEKVTVIEQLSLF